ncbi:MAG: Hpt domain-containing protein [Deltaproteobacteria bacterium]|nr:Hpt domain-containing protein [Deltaproteobacteria bacterium]
MPILRALSAPPEVMGAVVAAFPGAVLIVDGEGQIADAFGGPTSPLALDRVPGRALHQVLALDDTSDGAGILALWLACAIGVDRELFTLTLGDPPRHLPAALGRGALELDYGAIYDAAGLTSAVVVFVRPGAATAARPAASEAASTVGVEQFFSETQALLEDCGAELVTLERDRDARGAVARMFRAIHTLKGAARAAGLGSIAALAHQLEDVLDTLRAPDRRATTEELATTRRLLGVLGQQVLHDAPHDTAIDAMAALYGGYRPLIMRAEAALTAWQSRPRDLELGAVFARALDQLRDTVAAFHMRGPDARLAAVVGITALLRATRRPERRLLAELEQAMAALHELFELYRDVYRELRAHDRAAEIVLDLGAVRRGSVSGIREVAPRHHLAVVASAAHRLGDAAALAELIDDLPRMLAPTPAALGPRCVLTAAQRVVGESLDVITAVATELAAERPAAEARLTAVAATLRATAARLTWVPLDDLFRRVRQQATTLAAELGKSVDVEIQAFAAIVPEAIYQRVADVLVHAIRNALDHGIEPPEARVAAGKRATGTLAIAVAIDDIGVQLDLIDDGAGVDLERVRTRAIERGLIAATDLLDEHALHELVFHPGLSTASRVSDVSGRGVGMDAIRALAESGGGSATLSSHRGRGTTLALRLPLVPPAVPAARTSAPDLRAIGS